MPDASPNYNSCVMHDVEWGIRNVSLVTIEKIAKGLKRTLPDLFSRVTEDLLPTF